jgi:hypothetical protein
MSSKRSDRSAELGPSRDMPVNTAEQTCRPSRAHMAVTMSRITRRPLVTLVRLEVRRVGMVGCNAYMAFASQMVGNESMPFLLPDSQ